SKEKAALFQHQ
ncbi:Diaminobutyrate--2-oxoglutarate aminotransferase, partial [Haemophilus influenzae]